MVYWTVMTFGALLAAASLAVSARFFALAIFETQPGQWVEHWLLASTPVGIELIALMVVYRVVPHRTIQWKFAALGALLAVVLIELLKAGIGSYLGSFGAYQKIYGPLAFVPIFLGWIYFGWVAILLGASLASSMSAFRYQPASQRLPLGYELYGLCACSGASTKRAGPRQGPASGRHQPARTDAHRCAGAAVLQQLSGIGLLSRANPANGCGPAIWTIFRSPNLRSLPVAHPGRRSLAARARRCVGETAVSALDELRIPLRDLLRSRSLRSNSKDLQITGVASCCVFRCAVACKPDSAAVPETAAPAEAQAATETEAPAADAAAVAKSATQTPSLKIATLDGTQYDIAAKRGGWWW